MTTTLQLYISSFIEQLNSRLNFGIGSNTQIKNLIEQLGFTNFKSLDSLQGIILILCNNFVLLFLLTLKNFSLVFYNITSTGNRDQNNEMLPNKF